MSGTELAALPFRVASVKGEPREWGQFLRSCRACGASFLDLAAGKTGQLGLWADSGWWCSIECAPKRLHADALAHNARLAAASPTEPGPTDDERPATGERDCPHESSTGDEGPVSELGSAHVVRWRCDGCGAVHYSDEALASLRAEMRAASQGQQR